MGEKQAARRERREARSEKREANRKERGASRPRRRKPRGSRSPGVRTSDAEWQWDRNRLTLYFTAERRVDFRKLVRELAGAFRTRIELRQIGVRDEAARLGGIGRGGREFCCSPRLTEPGPVNLALAKDQHPP